MLDTIGVGWGYKTLGNPTDMFQLIEDILSCHTNNILTQTSNQSVEKKIKFSSISNNKKIRHSLFSPKAIARQKFTQKTKKHLRTKKYRNKPYPPRL